MITVKITKLDIAETVEVIRSMKVNKSRSEEELIELAKEVIAYLTHKHKLEPANDEPAAVELEQPDIRNTDPSAGF